MDKIKARKFRRWVNVNKIYLARAYTWCQLPMMGVVFAGSLKVILPGYFDSALKSIGLIIVCFIILYTIGYLDKKWGFCGDELSYTTEINPTLMNGLRGGIK